MHNPDKILGKLKKKGWSEDEVEHARLVFEEHRLEHHIFPPIVDLTIYWIVIITIVASNIAAFFFMLPMIVVFDNIFSYAFIGVLGFSLGLVFELVMRDLTHLEKHHKFFISAIIPVLSVLIFLYLMYFIQRNFQPISNPFRHPLYFSLTYSISFILPYYVQKIRDK